MKSGDKKYLIMAGVRRAKAYSLLGYATIHAMVYNQDGTQAGEIEVALDDLLSPKSAIDMSTTGYANRFWSVWRVIFSGQGDKLPLIEIMPGGHGTPIAQVGWIL